MWMNKHEFHTKVLAYTKQHLSAYATTEMVTNATPTKCIVLNGTLLQTFSQPLKEPKDRDHILPDKHHLPISAATPPMCGQLSGLQ